MFLLTKYTRIGASSRYRTFQFLPTLRKAGLHCTVSPLFDDAYLMHKYEYGRASVLHLLSAFARRLWIILNMPQDVVVMVEYELLPFGPALIERWLVWRGCRLVVDYDDPLFHQYDQHTSFWVRRLLGRKIATVMRLADTVIAGNAYLSDYAWRAGAKRVVVIPTVVDLMRYPLLPAAINSTIFTIGWIGSPTTAKYLHAVGPALAAVCQGGRARLRVIGSGPINMPGVPLECLDWSEATEVDQMRSFDVGIMPLPDEPWARGKCGFKLIQYMACGLPVVASPVGVNAEIVEEGVNGYLARSIDDWQRALARLMASSDDCKRMGQAGRRKVEAEFSLQVTAPKVLKVIREAANRHV